MTVLDFGLVAEEYRFMTSGSGAQLSYGDHESITV